MEGGKDPIALTQQRVYRAFAMCQLLADASESASSTHERDLMSALLGLAEMLDDVHSDLDPTEFRKAVLASESAGVAHG